MLATIFPIPSMWGLVLSTLAGILKEVYDKGHADIHTEDKWDAVATIGGGLIGFIALVIK
jgi:hypothetical protein